MDAGLETKVKEMIELFFVDINIDGHGGFRVDVHQFNYGDGKHIPKHWNTTMVDFTAKEVASFIYCNAAMGVTRIIFDTAGYGSRFKESVLFYLANPDSREDEAYLERSGVIRRYKDYVNQNKRSGF